jgi:hypothetical protein
MIYNHLEKTLNGYNWDDGFAIPKKILGNPHCDLALALKIFYLADGFAYLDGFAEKTKSKEWEQFIYSLYTDIWSNKFRKNRRPYKIPLTKVQKYKFRKKQVPEIFLTDL